MEVYFIKATSKTLFRLRNTLKYKNCANFEKAAFDVLVFHYAFQIGCIYISNCGLNTHTH